MSGKKKTFRPADLAKYKELNAEYGAADIFDLMNGSDEDAKEAFVSRAREASDDFVEQFGVFGFLKGTNEDEYQFDEISYNSAVLKVLRIPYCLVIYFGFLMDTIEDWDKMLFILTFQQEGFAKTKEYILYLIANFPKSRNKLQNVFNRTVSALAAEEDDNDYLTKITDKGIDDFLNCGYELVPVEDNEDDDEPEEVNEAVAAANNSIEELKAKAGDYASQIDSIDEAELTESQKKDYKQLKSLMGDIHGKIDESQKMVDHYSEHLKRQKEREENDKAEKIRRAIKNTTKWSRADYTVTMYIILTDEKKLGRYKRAQKEFCELYQEHFPLIAEKEIIQLRKEIYEVFDDKEVTEAYKKQFKQRSVEDRFNITTEILYNDYKIRGIDVQSEWALANSNKWFSTAEREEVQKLMDELLEKERTDMKEQLESLDSSFVDFSICRQYLRIVIDQNYDRSYKIEPDFDNFEIKVLMSAVGHVELSRTQGMATVSLAISNSFPWFWGVTIRDIWETAFANQIVDNCPTASCTAIYPERILDCIRYKYNDMKIIHPDLLQSIEDVCKKTIYTNIIGDSNDPYSSNKINVEDIKRETEELRKITQQINEAQQLRAAQQTHSEGCYIATAVYGSYEAPEVMTLRSYRDNVLKKTALGRWFIRTYYRLSPPVAERLKDAHRINRFVRSILDKWVEKLNRRFGRK